MRNKLKINSDHYSIETLRKVYVKTRVENETNKHIASRLRKDIKNLFIDVESIFKYLSRMYEDLNRKHTTMKEFRTLR